ncbi:MAG: WYL domain-containing protein, partial [Acidimicrobiia bacterium]|nr:WYL domain-containing protein [Acidimicrobiia bacterium]
AGGITATMSVANIEAFIGWMLGFDDGAEILEPESLRNRLIDRVRGVA